MVLFGAAWVVGLLVLLLVAAVGIQLVVFDIRHRWVRRRRPRGREIQLHHGHPRVDD